MAFSLKMLKLTNYLFFIKSRMFCSSANVLQSKKVFVMALSGGVDSSAAAILLKQQFSATAEIHGVHLRSWQSGGNGDDDENEACPAATTDDDYKDAKLVADALKIDLSVIDLVRDYWLNVFEPMLVEYCDGFTPNPDIDCNQSIKFGALLEKIDSKYGRDAILATGHYAQIENGLLMTSTDSLHDQTFFLSQVGSLALSRSMFPVGHLTKDEARKIVGFSFGGKLRHILDRPSSAGLCFVGRRRSFADFMDNFIPPKPGRFIDVDTSREVGQHTGRHHFAVGQRVRIPGVERPFYVAVKRLADPNDILVAAGAGHPSLYTRIVTTAKPFWIGPSPFSSSKRVPCYFRFQHQHPLVRCEIEIHGNGLKINLTERAMRAVSPGQYAVFYLPVQSSLGAYRCLGSAKIVDNRPSLRDEGISVHQTIHQTLFA